MKTISLWDAITIEKYGPNYTKEERKRIKTEIYKAMYQAGKSKEACALAYVRYLECYEGS